MAVVGYFGGFRNVELKALKFGFLIDGDSNCTSQKVVEKSEDGSYWFTFYRSKQRGCQIVSQICVPKCSNEMIKCRDSVERVPLGVCPASVIDEYLNVLASDFNCCIEDLDGDFFKSTHGKNANKFVKVPLGKNKLSRVGIEFAQELMLPNPTAYTGHCWRRSCSTNSSDAGVNVTSLMAHMGWADPKTAIRYVQKSKQSAHQMAMYLCNAQRFNLKPDELFQLPKVVPDLKSTYLPSRIQFPAAADSNFSSINSSNCHDGVDNDVADNLFIDDAQNIVRSDLESGSLDVKVDKSVVDGVTVFPVTVLPTDPAFVLPTAPSALSAPTMSSSALSIVPIEQVANQSLSSGIESSLARLIGSIVNSGTINFNIQFVSK